jgi:hypothetical protein
MFIAFFSPPNVPKKIIKVIKHELSYGPLDFNFQNNNQEGSMVETINGGDVQQQHPTANHNHGQYQPARTSNSCNSWVH